MLSSIRFLSSRLPGNRFFSVSPSKISHVLSELGLDSGSSAGPHSGLFAGGKWIGADQLTGPVVDSVSPADNQVLGQVQEASATDCERHGLVEHAQAAQRDWAKLPAPRRGEVVRLMGEALRHRKAALGALVSLEMGKIASEGLGEVQEYVDVCDLAVGMSRSQLGGQVLPSERPGHTMLEVWQPAGVVGVVSAFNFPVAVYGWNSAVALVCGNAVVWKGAPSTPLCTLAVTRLLQQVLEQEGLPGALVSAVCAGADVGKAMAQDARLPVFSFTGSTAVGRAVGAEVQQRFGRPILELGGNNAVVVLKDADLDLVQRAVVFGAAGTAGQRCTTTRRLLVERPVYDEVVERVGRAYGHLRVGHPLDPNTLVGPLHSADAVQRFVAGVRVATEEHGGRLVCGGRALHDNYVEPAVVADIAPDAPCVQEELFAPLLYISPVDSLDDAIRYNNAVPHGLSASLFTRDLQAMWRWIHSADCGIVNVNIGTSGAEIGGAFGGNKETGWGREAGSDAWKGYMTRHTCTVNYSNELPLAQGVKFD